MGPREARKEPLKSLAVSQTSPPKITTKKQASGSIASKLEMIDVREGAVYLELVQPQLHALTEELIHWWMRCRRNFSREQPLRKHSRRRQKDQSEQQFRFYASKPDPRGARRTARDKSSP